jgi:hypothetical protein
VTTAVCRLCRGPCVDHLFTLPTCRGERVTICPSCYVCVERDPQRAVDAGYTNGNGDANGGRSGTTDRRVRDAMPFGTGADST